MVSRKQRNVKCSVRLAGDKKIAPPGEGASGLELSVMRVFVLWPEYCGELHPEYTEINLKYPECDHSSSSIKYHQDLSDIVPERPPACEAERMKANQLTIVANHMEVMPLSVRQTVTFAT